MGLRRLGMLVSLAAVGAAAEALHHHGHAPAHAPAGYWTYSTVTGVFKQDDPATDPSTFNYTRENFGLIERAYDTDRDCDPRRAKTQWQRFEGYVDSLNRHAPVDVQYKVLYMGRHGEGYHNAAESFYGTPLWNCYWSLQPGNATANWTDAALTPSGSTQARVANNFWKTEIAEQKIPVPQSYYTSPLQRCLQTAQTTFAGLDLPRPYPFVPTVKELLREGIGLHTCDKRSSKTWIHAHYPGYPIEPGFTEGDELWKPDLRESSSAQAARLRRLLDDVFTHDRHTFISFTSHSGSIAAILSVIGHRSFSLNTGAVIPVLVKAQFIHGKPPPTSIAPSSGAPTCSTNPTASPF